MLYEDKLALARKAKIESETFQRIIEHLRNNPDVQNIDMMNLANFCRNCISKWYMSESEKIGIKISYDEVLSLAKGSIGRPHIAHVLINNGYASSVNDAFDRFISSEILGKIREPRLGIKEAIEVIKSAGGISIYAHPNINTKTFFNDLRELKTMGLNGIEVSSPRYGLSRQKELLEIFKQNGVTVGPVLDLSLIHI